MGYGADYLLWPTTFLYLTYKHLGNDYDIKEIHTLIKEAETIEFELEPTDLRRLSNLCGPFDENLKHIERRLGVEITHRGHHFRLIGHAHTVAAVQNILRDLYVETATVKGQEGHVEPQQVHLAIQQAKVLEQDDTDPAAEKMTHIKTKRGLIKPRNHNQAGYVRSILAHDVNFGIGPAGTGKTYLAVACAVDALEREVGGGRLGHGVFLGSECGKWHRCDERRS